MTQFPFSFKKMQMTDLIHVCYVIFSSSFPSLLISLSVKVKGRGGGDKKNCTSGIN